MVDARAGAAHLSDAEIDAYWKGTLPPAEEERVEQHYLDCADCQNRVRLVETLVDALRAEPPPRAPSVRPWQIAAAVFAALAVGASWQWARVARDARDPAAIFEGPAVDAPARMNLAALSALVVPLAPPTRDAQPAEVRLSSDVSLVVFELDAREAGAPGSRFNVSLADPTGRVLLRLVDIVSTPAGTIRLPVERSVLRAGHLLFEVTTDSGTVAMPFLIRQADSR